MDFFHPAPTRTAQMCRQTPTDVKQSPFVPRWHPAVSQLPELLLLSGHPLWALSNSLLNIETDVCVQTELCRDPPSVCVFTFHLQLCNLSLCLYHKLFICHLFGCNLVWNVESHRPCSSHWDPPQTNTCSFLQTFYKLFLNSSFSTFTVCHTEFRETKMTQLTSLNIWWFEYFLQ